MKLLGGYGSPFVRRVAITMRIYGLDYEHQPDVRNNGIIEQFNPFGRIPALILDSGEAIIDSATILDYLDRQVGSDRSLTPLNGEHRTRMLSLLALAVGATEKAVAALYEIERRPREKWYAPYAEQLAGQFKRSYEHLDNQFKGPWMMGDELSQLEVTPIKHAATTAKTNHRDSVFVLWRKREKYRVLVKLLFNDVRVRRHRAPTTANTELNWRVV